MSASAEIKIDLDVYLFEFEGAVELLLYYQAKAPDPTIFNLFYEAWLKARSVSGLDGYRLLFCPYLIQFELEILNTLDIDLAVYADALAVCWQWEMGKVKLALTTI